MNARTVTASALLTTGLLASSLAPSAAFAASSDGPAYACRQDVEPQNPDHPGVHVAALEEAPNGDLLYSFYAGQGERADDVATYLSRYAVGEEGWTPPIVIFDEPNEADGNAVLYTDDRTGRVHLLFSIIMGDAWTEADLRHIWSDDNGVTWSDPVHVREEWGWLFGTLPFEMSNGEILVPIYSETVWSVGFYVSDDGFASFDVYPGEDDTAWPKAGGGAIQPATVELEDGHLLAYLRTRNEPEMWQTESFDYGRTWTDAEPNGLPQNNSRVALIKLQDGTLVMSYNPVTSGRTPLSLAYSTDNGATWSAPQAIEDASTAPLLPFGNPEFSYPYLLESSDGMIHLAYTHRRDTMRHIVFNKAFLETGEAMASDISAETKTEYADGQFQQVQACQHVHSSGAGAAPATEAPAPEPEPAPAEEPAPALPTTGGGVALAGFAVMAASLRWRRRTT